MPTGWAVGLGANLVSTRLVLPRLSEADLEAIVALHSDPEVMAYITGVGESRPVVEAQSMPDLLARETWAIRMGSSGFVGWVSLRLESRQAELGYRIARSSWNTGVASEAARAVVTWGFESLHLTRIWAQTMAVNLGSRRVMEKVGMTYVRTFFPEWEYPLPGSEQGEVEYALTNEHWTHR